MKTKKTLSTLLLLAFFFGGMIFENLRNQNHLTHNDIHGNVYTPMKLRDAKLLSKRVVLVSGASGDKNLNGSASWPIFVKYIGYIHTNGEIAIYKYKSPTRIFAGSWKKFDEVLPDDTVIHFVL